MQPAGTNSGSVEAVFPAWPWRRSSEVRVGVVEAEQHGTAGQPDPVVVEGGEIREGDRFVPGFGELLPAPEDLEGTGRPSPEPGLTL